MSKYNDLFTRGGLSLDRLRTLVEIADAGSMTRAARGAPSQLALFSRQLKELEAFFGVKLADRRGRALLLNDNGRGLVRIAREALDGLAGFAGQCRDLPRELAIGAGNSLIEWWLTPRLSALRAALPRTNIHLLSLRTADAIARLGDLTLDLAIVRSDAVAPPLKMRPLFPLSYALFVPEKLAAGLTARNILKKLPELPLALSLGGQFREQLEVAAARAGVTLHVAVACTSFTQAARTTAAGVAAAILPEIAASEFCDTTVQTFRLPLLSDYTRPLALAWHPRRESANSAIPKAAALLLTSK